MKEYIVTLAEVLKKREIEKILTFSEVERTAFAEDMEVRAVNQINANLIVKPIREGRGISVIGEIRAEILQNCVVTLNPVQENVQEKLHLRYLQEADMPVPVTEEEGAFINIRDSDFDIEPLVNKEVNLYEIIRETLLLNLTPFPKSKEAETADFNRAPPEEESISVNRPFEILAEYKEKLLKN